METAAGDRGYPGPARTKEQCANVRRGLEVGKAHIFRDGEEEDDESVSVSSVGKSKGCCCRGNLPLHPDRACKRPWCPEKP